ncbi:class I SAM-dependent methyltransferase [uncultured Pseudokineococcus sp.]|uniref:class I SAM-dependent methyltransferase n=1 Tax=uncultured Pseudokineococcus sp. TaxID=1642928 RepID=UPI002617F6D0|nr:class I SAM-dependent methyltransferase [uncultured Pseudokineococcus sp.]
MPPLPLPDEARPGADLDGTAPDGTAPEGAAGEDVLPGVRPSPNAWYHPDAYALENTHVDPDRRVDAVLREVAGWAGLDVVDVGCGLGVMLGRLAGLDPGPGEDEAAAARGAARSVVGVEPHPPLRERAQRRARELDPAGTRVRVVAGTAQALPLPDASVDVVLARWAYFFGPGCEPGLAEAERVLRPGGAVVVVDTDPSRSTFGGWFSRARPRHDAAAVRRFWRRQGFCERGVDVRWAFPDRASFEAVVRVELPPALADEVLAAHPGTALDDAVAVRWRRTPGRPGSRTDDPADDPAGADVGGRA